MHGSHKNREAQAFRRCLLFPNMNPCCSHSCPHIRHPLLFHLLFLSSHRLCFQISRSFHCKAVCYFPLSSPSLYSCFLNYLTFIHVCECFREIQKRFRLSKGETILFGYLSRFFIVLSTSSGATSNEYRFSILSVNL